MKISTALLMAATTFVGCVPARRIEMQHQGADTATITWRVKEDNIGTNPFVISNSRELRFDLYAPHRRHIKMSFGPGGWSPTEVAQLVDWLEWVELKTPSLRIRLDSAEQIKTFLLARRRGLSGARIVISLP